MGEAPVGVGSRRAGVGLKSAAQILCSVCERCDRPPRRVPPRHSPVHCFLNGRSPPLPPPLAESGRGPPWPTWVHQPRPLRDSQTDLRVTAKLRAERGRPAGGPSCRCGSPPPPHRLCQCTTAGALQYTTLRVPVWPAGRACGPTQGRGVAPPRATARYVSAGFSRSVSSTRGFLATSEAQNYFPYLHVTRSHPGIGITAFVVGSGVWRGALHCNGSTRGLERLLDPVKRGVSPRRPSARPPTAKTSFPVVCSPPRLPPACPTHPPSCHTVSPARLSVGWR